MGERRGENWCGNDDNLGSHTVRQLLPYQAPAPKGKCRGERYGCFMMPRFRSNNRTAQVYRVRSTNHHRQHARPHIPNFNRPARVPPFPPSSPPQTITMDWIPPVNPQAPSPRQTPTPQRNRLPAGLPHQVLPRIRTHQLPATHAWPRTRSKLDAR